MSVTIVELKREGVFRDYRISAEGTHVAALVHERLLEMGKSLRLPGFRPGKIPLEHLQSRYGARARSEVLGRIRKQATEQLLAGGGLPASVELSSGAESGEVEFRLTVTHLPDLPEIDFATWELEKLIASDELLTQAGLNAAEAETLFAQILHQKVFDRLHETYQFPLAEQLVERELEAILNASKESYEIPKSELREIAERRVRLGAVILELARRHRIEPAKGDPILESRVIDWLISKARVNERATTLEELTTLTE